MGVRCRQVSAMRAVMPYTLLHRRERISWKLIYRLHRIVHSIGTKVAFPGMRPIKHSSDIQHFTWCWIGHCNTCIYGFFRQTDGSLQRLAIESWYWRQRLALLWSSISERRYRCNDTKAGSDNGWSSLPIAMVPVSWVYWYLYRYFWPSKRTDPTVNLLSPNLSAYIARS